MKKGVVAVACDCNTLRVVPNCKVAEVGYDYVGVNRKEQVVQLKGADELKVNLPLSANKLGAEVQAGRSIDLGLVYVGRRSTVVGKVKRGELKGACEGVTHYLLNATVGAFALSTGATGKAAAVAEVFQVGASAKSESSRHAASSDGSLEACRGSDAGSEAPPAECGSPLRVELIPIAADAPALADAGPKGKAEPGGEKDAALEAKKALAQKVEANPCRDGYVWAEGICARRGARPFCASRTTARRARRSEKRATRARASTTVSRSRTRAKTGRPSSKRPARAATRTPACKSSATSW